MIKVMKDAKAYDQLDQVSTVCGVGSGSSSGQYVVDCWVVAYSPGRCLICLSASFHSSVPLRIAYNRA